MAKDFALTSGSMSPMLKRGIGLSYLDLPFGTSVEVQIRNKQLKGRHSYSILMSEIPDNWPTLKIMSGYRQTTEKESKLVSLITHKMRFPMLFL